jgi:hypothetical protein
LSKLTAIDPILVLLESRVRTQRIEVARLALENLVKDLTSVKPISRHHVFSTLTSEEIVIFTLAKTSRVREARTR